MGRAKLQISRDFLNSLFYGAKFNYLDARINNWDADACIELVVESDKLPEHDPSCHLPIITVRPEFVYHAPVLKGEELEVE